MMAKKIEENINRWNISAIPGIKYEKIYDVAINSRVLDMMRKENLKDLAVIDKKGKLLGIVTFQKIRDRLIDQLIDRIN